MSSSFSFPKTFATARTNIKRKFPLIDQALIEDGIQYASIEYWKQEINNTIGSENEALRWLLKVARNYIIKDIGRSKRYSRLSAVVHQTVPVDYEEHFMQIDLLNNLLNKLSERRKKIIIQHGMGYSLEEIAGLQDSSIQAIKQQHSKALQTLRLGANALKKAI